MSDVRWPRDWEADRDPLTDDYWVFSPTILARDVREVPVYVPLRPNGTPDLDGLLARLRCDPAEVERLRERLDALAWQFEIEAAFAYDGWQRRKGDHLEGVYRVFRRAAEKVRALAERGERDA